MNGKKYGSALLSLLLSVSVLAACSGGSQGGSSGGAAQPEASGGADDGAGGSAAEKVIVDFWVLTGGQETAMKAVAEDFAEDHPNIEVKITTHATDPHKEALKVAAASGTLPDMWFNWGGSLGSYYPENGFTLDLSEHAKMNDWKTKYVESALDLATFDGQLSGVPWHIYGMGVWYRKDLFEKFGISVPTTFAEFEAAMAKLKENGVTPISTGGKGGWHPMRFLEGVLEHYAGPDLHDKLMAMEESWNQEAVINTYAKWKEWNEKGYFPQGFLTLDPSETKFLLYNGQAGMVLEGPWFDGTLNADQQDPSLYGFFPLPTDHAPVRISSFVEMFQINKDSPKAEQDAALMLAEYITSKDVIAKHGEVLGAPQALKDAPVSEKLPHVPAIVDALGEGVYLVTDQALPQEIVQKFFQAQDSIITGEMSPEEAAKFMQDEVEKFQAK